MESLETLLLYLDAVLSFDDFHFFITFYKSIPKHIGSLFLIKFSLNSHYLLKLLKVGGLNFGVQVETKALKNRSTNDLAQTAATGKS